MGDVEDNPKTMMEAVEGTLSALAAGSCFPGPSRVEPQEMRKLYNTIRQLAELCDKHKRTIEKLRRADLVVNMIAIMGMTYMILDVAKDVLPIILK